MAIETTKLQNIEVTDADVAKNKLLLLKLIKHFPEEFKALFITSKIRAFMPKFDRAQALVKGDIYYTNFIEENSLEPAAFQKLYNSIVDGLITQDGKITKEVQKNSKLSDAVNLVFLDKQPDSTKPEFLIEKAFRVIGESIAAGSKEEEERQYQAAVANDPQHVLEHRELKLLGHPYETIFKEKLPLLEELNSQGYGNFNRVIRNLVLQHQRKEITLDKFLDRLRYSAAMLAIALEQRGYIDESLNIRTTIFGDRFVGDGKLPGAFVDRNNPNPKKKIPILTQETKNEAAGFFSKLKNYAKDLPGLLGFKDRVLPKAIATTSINPELPQQMADFLNKLEIDADPEAIRKLENRVVKLRMTLNDMALAEFAAQNLDADDPIRTELPYNDPQLLRAFAKHLERLEQGIQSKSEFNEKLDLMM